METNFLKDLNESQRRAVEYIDGPSLVIAGAGSGKTRVLTFKIAHLLELGIKPWNILALTFTNKAAREMKERIAKLVGESRAQSLWMGTFHSLFSRMLRQEASLLNYTANYTIYQPSDSKSLVKAILKELNLDDKTYKPSTVCGKISEAKNALVFPEQYNSDAETYRRDAKSNMPLLGTVYQKYMARMHQANAMDFDDLLLNTYLLFYRFPDVRRKYVERFHYILVDEYQDTNFAQHEIMRLLSEGNDHICVVGDDAQSIYSFRGARIDNILKFTSQHPGAKLFKLEQNYRSTQTIVNAANSLIAYNKVQIKKNVFSENEKGNPIILHVAYSDVEEGEIVCNQIKRLHVNQSIDYQNIAILYRTNAQSRIFEEGLRKRSIPYRIYGGHSFYDQKEIRDVLAYFRLTVNPNDEEALKRIINFPTRGIGNTTLTKLVETAVANDVGIWTVLKTPQNYNLPVSASTLTKLRSFYELIESFIEMNTEKDAYELGSLIIKQSGILQEAYKSRDAESQEMQENLSELLNGMNTFVDMQRESGSEAFFLTDYLSEVSLLSEQDNKDTEDKDMVTLMTVHSAKGLEFDAVFVVGMEENLFPNALAMYSEHEMEEERRLFYVAITRAKTYCYLSCSKMRFHYGKMDFCNPSSFLKEIDRECIRLMEKDSPTPDYGSTNAFAPQVQRKKPFVSEMQHAGLRALPTKHEDTAEEEEHQSVTANGIELCVGCRVQHDRFGIGEIIKLEGEVSNIKATISFQNSGRKILLLKFAKLKLI